MSANKRDIASVYTTPSLSVFNTLLKPLNELIRYFTLNMYAVKKQRKSSKNSVDSKPNSGKKSKDVKKPVVNFPCLSEFNLARCVCDSIVLAF